MVELDYSLLSILAVVPSIKYPVSELNRAGSAETLKRELNRVVIYGFGLSKQITRLHADFCEKLSRFVVFETNLGSWILDGLA